MQIVCNHCGNQLSFPDYQNLVTCNHCATHLQIEEKETTYSASVIDEKEFEELLILKPIINYREVSYPLINLLNLENQFSEIIRLTNSFSFLSWCRIEPTLFRVVYRFIIAFIVIRELQVSRNSFANIEESIILPLIIYVCVIILFGIVELVQWFMLRSFKQMYNKESKEIEDTIDIDLLLSNSAVDTNWYQAWKNNEADFNQVKNNLSYINLRFKFPIGLPSVSKGSRIFVIVFPMLLWVFKLSFIDGYLFSSFMLLIFTLFFSWFSFKLMLNGDEYKNEYQAYHIKRKKLLQELKDFIEK